MQMNPQELFLSQSRAGKIRALSSALAESSDNETIDGASTAPTTSSAYGFTAPAAFTESQAECYLGSGWLNTNHWSHDTSGTGSNWRVVLHNAS